MNLSSLSSKDQNQVSCDKDDSDIPVNRSIAANSSKQSMKSKIYGKQNKQKFEFIYYKSVFRHFCSHFKTKYLEFTENKKVRQNQLKEVSELFVDHFLKSIGIIDTFEKTISNKDKRDSLLQEIGTSVMALTHLNKFSNPLFKQYKGDISIIRNVTQQFNKNSYQNFIND